MDDVLLSVLQGVMEDRRTLDELKSIGAGRPAPTELVCLYRSAFTDYGTRSLWNWRLLEQPTIAQVLAIAESLRVEGNLKARALAVQIERACRAAL